MYAYSNKEEIHSGTETYRGTYITYVFFFFFICNHDYDDIFTKDTRTVNDLYITLYPKTTVIRMYLVYKRQDFCGVQISLFIIP